MTCRKVGGVNLLINDINDVFVFVLYSVVMVFVGCVWIHGTHIVTGLEVTSHVTDTQLREKHRLE